LAPVDKAAQGAFPLCAVLSTGDNDQEREEKE